MNSLNQRHTWGDRLEGLRHGRHGREADPELAEECIHYLRNEHPQLRRRHQAGGSERKTRQRLLSAHVRRQAAGAGRPLPEVERVLREQDDRLRRQARAIDHLLTYVRPRAHRLDEGRLAEIAARLRDAAPARAVVTVVPETSEETLSAHRFEVRAPTEDSAQLLDLEDRLIQLLAEDLSPEEGPAVRLSVGRLD